LADKHAVQHHEFDRTTVTGRRCVPTLYIGQTYEAAAFETVFRNLPPKPLRRQVFDVDFAGRGHVRLLLNRDLILGPFFHQNLARIGQTRQSMIDTDSTPLRERSLLAREGFGQGLGDEADSFFLRIRRMLLEEPLYDGKRLPLGGCQRNARPFATKDGSDPHGVSNPCHEAHAEAGLVGAGVGTPRPQIIACVESSEFLRRRRQAGHRDGDRHGDEPRAPVHTAALLVLTYCRRAMILPTVTCESCAPRAARSAEILRGEHPAHHAGPWPHFARSIHARIATSASGSSSGSAARCSALRNLVRLRLMEAAIADFAAGGGGVGLSSWAGDGAAGSASSGGGAVASTLLRFRTTAGTSSAIAFRFFGGRL
jgi:hypothetical protein